VCWTTRKKAKRKTIAKAGKRSTRGGNQKRGEAKNAGTIKKKWKKTTKRCAPGGEGERKKGARNTKVTGRGGGEPTVANPFCGGEEKN